MTIIYTCVMRTHLREHEKMSNKREDLLISSHCNLFVVAWPASNNGADIKTIIMDFNILYLLFRNISHILGPYRFKSSLLWVELVVFSYWICDMSHYDT